MRQAELTLDEMLADEIVRLVMARDGVSEAQVRGVLDRVRDLRRRDTALPLSQAA